MLILLPLENWKYLWIIDKIAGLNITSR